MLCPASARAQGGVPLWTNRFNGPANNSDVGRVIAIDGSGNVFVGGGSDGNGTASDYVTVKYSNAGVPIWTNYYNGPGNGHDSASAIAVDSSGNVFVTGYSYGIGTGSDLVPITYSSSIPLPRLDFQLQNNQLVLDWTNTGFNLQSAPAIIGTFTNLPGATSPFTNALTGPQQFFRLKGDGRGQPIRSVATSGKTPGTLNDWSAAVSKTSRSVWLSRVLRPVLSRHI